MGESVVAGVRMDNARHPYTYVLDTTPVCRMSESGRSLAAVLPRCARLCVQMHARKTSERLLIHLPIGHELDARVMLDRIVKRLTGLWFE